METGEALANVEARAVTYSFLSGMFLREVSQDFLERLAAEPPHLGGELEGFAVGLATADLSTVRRDAAAEFAALLLGMSADPVHPYESVYTSPEHLLMQEARDEVVACYLSEGLGLPAENTTPEDHLSFELQFMAKLIERAQAALEAGDDARYAALCEKQRLFFDEHLAGWVPRLCADVRAYARTAFYRGIADITEGFLALEDQVIEPVGKAA